MGTRSLTVFVDGETEIAVLYRQMDGYLEGHGKDLAEYLSGRIVVNGYTTEDARNGAFNGIGDLAVRVITAMKLAHDQKAWDAPGNFYLYPAKTRDCGEEYTYYVSATEKTGVQIKALDGSDEVFSGTPEDFMLFIKRLK